MRGRRERINNNDFTLQGIFDIIYWNMREYILRRFGEAGLEISPEQAEKFLRYYELLCEWNNRFNLTAITAFEDVVLKHFIDSAHGARYLGGGTLCDIGAGAGFPSIPLKILRNDLKLTMLDSSNKKVLFLSEAVKELGLGDCRCLHARAEEAARGHLRESFDAVTARAVAGLNALCEYALPLVKVGGVFLAYKGDAEEEIKSAERAIEVLGGRLERADSFYLSGTEHRRTLILIRKVKKTDSKYPRGRGRERSDPL